MSDPRPDRVRLFSFGCIVDMLPRDKTRFFAAIRTFCRHAHVPSAAVRRNADNGNGRCGDAGSDDSLFWTLAAAGNNDVTSRLAFGPFSAPTESWHIPARRRLKPVFQLQSEVYIVTVTITSWAFASTFRSSKSSQALRDASQLCYSLKGAAYHQPPVPSFYDRCGR